MTIELILDCGPLARHGAEAGGLEDRVQRAKAAGYRSFFCSYEPKALKALGRGQDLYVVTPDAGRYVRDMNNYGLIRMGLRRVSEAGPGLLSLIPVGLKNALGVLKKDFSNILVILTALEMVRFRRYRPKAVFLHAQMTDLFLANNAGEPIRRFAGFVRRTYGARPGLCTQNMVCLIDMLERERLDIDFLCAPINPAGYMMKPDPEAVARRVQGWKGTVVADDITCGGAIPLLDALAYLKPLGVEMAVVAAPVPPDPGRADKPAVEPSSRS